jgi:DNA modification methylase
VTGRDFTAMLGDSCQRLAEIDENSIDLSVYSPPFADLYTYSASELDLGNSKNWDEFFQHYAFIIRELLRVTKIGRMTCVHTSDIAAMSIKDGYIGLRDFPGAVVQAYEKEGWIFFGRAIVAKNPQAQAIRTKSRELQFAGLESDRAKQRGCLPDYLIKFRAKGENQTPITCTSNGISRNEWIALAEAAWTDIRETDTLNVREGRDDDDTKHICPLQLQVIDRLVRLFSNEGELVFSPFTGIGSEGYTSLKRHRRFYGCELKDTYYEAAKKNMLRALEERETEQGALFVEAGAA